jgi:hypothetical protein
MSAPRPFELIVDIDDVYGPEPMPRRFGSLSAALKAYAEYGPRWRRFAWIYEHHADGGVTVLMRDGVLDPAAEAALRQTPPNEGGQ